MSSVRALWLFVERLRDAERRVEFALHWRPHVSKDALGLELLERQRAYEAALGYGAFVREKALRHAAEEACRGVS